MMKYTLLIVISFLCVSNINSQRLKGTRPNIVLVMTDDQGSNLSYMGHPYVSTPRIDAFAEKAIRLTDFHVSPTCAPSRAAIMSGRHEFRNGVTHTVNERELMALSTTTFPQLLSKNGYATGIFGKWHLGDIEEYLPGNRGFTESLTHGAGGIGQLYPGSCADFPPNRESSKRYYDPVLLHNKTIVQTIGYCADIFFNASLGWMKEQLDHKKPFFTYLATNTPHSPLVSPQKYVDRIRKKHPELSKDILGRFGMIENIDDNFGKLLDSLEKWGALENTLIIFTTDNGAQIRDGKSKAPWNYGYKSGKTSPGEGGTHVPCFWYWKGKLQENKDVKALTSHIDFYSTFCDLAGVKIPDTIQKLDGRSLLPLLKDTDHMWDDDRLLFVNSGRWDKGKEPQRDSRWAVRSQRWRLVGNSLYDISKDPKEKKNVANQYPEVAKKLRKAYVQWWDETLPFMINEDREYDGVEPPLVTMYKKQKAEKGIPNWEPLNID